MVTLRRLLLSAAVAGGLVGLLGRNVPLAVAGWLADRIFGRVTVEGCTMERALECAFNDGPKILGAFFRYVMVLAGLLAVMALSGAVLILIGAVRKARVPETDIASATKPVTVRAVLVGAGAALVVPPCWLFGGLLVDWLVG